MNQQTESEPPYKAILESFRRNAEGWERLYRVASGQRDVLYRALKQIAHLANNTEWTAGVALGAIIQKALEDMHKE